MTIRALTIAEVAQRLGIEHETLRAIARRGGMPPPDVEVGVSTGRPVRGWTAETVDAWATARARNSQPRRRRAVMGSDGFVRVIEDG